LPKKISIPAYTEFQLIMSKAINNYERSIIKSVLKIPKHHLYAIERLLSNNNDTLDLADTIALPKNLSNSEIRLEIDRSTSIQSMYIFSKEWVKVHNISSESINYYSSLVPYYSRARLSNMKSALVPLYVMCFILKRYEIINDNLTDRV
jgi:methionine aminopeptidase